MLIMENQRTEKINLLERVKSSYSVKPFKLSIENVYNDIEEENLDGIEFGWTNIDEISFNDIKPLSVNEYGIIYRVSRICYKFKEEFCQQLSSYGKGDVHIEYALLKQFWEQKIPSISQDMNSLNRLILRSWIVFKISRDADDEILFYKRYEGLMYLWNNHEGILAFPTMGAINIRFSAYIDIDFLKKFRPSIVKSSQKSISYGSYIRKLQSFFKSNWCEFSSVHLEESRFGGDRLVIVWETDKPISFQNILDYPTLVLSFLEVLENPQISIEVMLDDIEVKIENDHKLSQDMSVDYPKLSFTKLNNYKLNNQKRIILGKQEKTLPLPY